MLLCLACMATAAAQLSNGQLSPGIEQPDVQARLSELQSDLEQQRGRYDNEVRALQLEFKALSQKNDQHLLYLLLGLFGGILAILGGYAFVRANIMKNLSAKVEKEVDGRLPKQVEEAIAGRLASEVDRKLPAMVETVLLENAARFREVIDDHEADAEIRAEARLLVVAHKASVAELLQKKLVEKHGFAAGNVAACGWPIPAEFGDQQWTRIIIDNQNGELDTGKVAEEVSKPGEKRYLHFGSGRFKDLGEYAFKIAFANYPGTFYPRLMEALRLDFEAKKQA